VGTLLHGVTDISPRLQQFLEVATGWTFERGGDVNRHRRFSCDSGEGGKGSGQYLRRNSRRCGRAHAATCTLTALAMRTARQVTAPIVAALASGGGVSLATGARLSPMRRCACLSGNCAARHESNGSPLQREGCYQKPEQVTDEYSHKVEMVPQTFE
jgi:hypothetical protein